MLSNSNKFLYAFAVKNYFLKSNLMNCDDALDLRVSHQKTQSFGIAHPQTTGDGIQVFTAIWRQKIILQPHVPTRLRTSPMETLCRHQYRGWLRPASAAALFFQRLSSGSL